MTVSKKYHHQVAPNKIPLVVPQSKDATKIPNVMGKA